MRPRTLLFVVLAGWALVPGWSGWERLPLLRADLQVTARRVALDPRDPARRRFGALTFLGGVSLTSTDPAFGGFSALHVTGDRVLLLSDGGNLVRFRLGSDGAVHAVLGSELPGGPGTGWRKLERDSESLAIDDWTGMAWVGFERANAIWRFGPDLRRATGSVTPPAMRRWPGNGGAEALAWRRDGSFVALQEEDRDGGPTRAGLFWPGDPVGTEPASFRYRPPPGFDPVDATELPDGRLLVLHRWWGLPLRFASSLSVIDRDAIRPGATVQGREIARIAAPLTAANYEGVAATVERGRTIIWLVADNDRMWRRRSLLLKFRLEG